MLTWPPQLSIPDPIPTRPDQFDAVYGDFAQLADLFPCVKQNKEQQKTQLLRMKYRKHEQHLQTTKICGRWSKEDLGFNGLPSLTYMVWCTFFFFCYDRRDCFLLARLIIDMHVHRCGGGHVARLLRRVQVDLQGTFPALRIPRGGHAAHPIQSCLLPGVHQASLLQRQLSRRYRPISVEFIG